jgi:hypothetical protein
VRGGVHQGKLHATISDGRNTTVLVDGNAPPKVTATVRALVRPFLGEPQLLEASLTVRTKAADGREREYTTIYVVHRGNLALACKIPGGYNSRPGKNCGGGGYDRVRVNREGSGWPLTIAVTTRRGGIHYRKRGNRCVPTSPVRSRPLTRRLTLAKGGTCKPKVKSAGAP